MKNRCLAGLVMMAMVATGVWAGNTPNKVASKEKPAEKELAVQEMTITGTVAKMETKKKDGTPLMTWFRLVDEAGSEVRVPKGKIEEFVGCKVKVTGEGYTLEKKNKSMRAFKTITTIEKLQDAAVPAAPVN
jgi:hypothetical protein